MFDDLRAIDARQFHFASDMAQAAAEFQLGGMAMKVSMSTRVAARLNDVVARAGSNR
jgi:hypothetical protein